MHRIMLIGVLSLQGAFEEHVDMVKSIGYDAIQVKTVEDLSKVDGMILPGMLMCIYHKVS